MHELAITESIVTSICERVDGARVTRVRLVIGQLSGVVPDAVRFCFEVCTAGTPVQGALLEVDEPAGRGRCRGCGAEVEIPDAIPLCGCGSADVELLGGQELVIKEVEVA